MKRNQIISIKQQLQWNSQRFNVRNNEESEFISTAQ